MPRYELRDGKTSKFWSIERDAKGKAFTLQWGRIGTDGQTAKKKFTQPYLCSAAYSKLVHEKVRKGYRIATGDAPAAAPAKRNAALEAAICDAPDDIERWSVYADWLQQEGDARGELIALHAAKKTAKAKAYARSHADALWGAAKYLTSATPFAGRTWVGWGETKPVAYETLGVALAMSKLGVVEQATFTGLDEDGHVAGAVADLLAAPLGAFVRALHFEVGESFEGDSGQPHYGMVCNALAHGKPHALRTLTFAHAGYQRSWTSSGELGPVLAATPRLEQLEIKLGTIQLGKRLHLPALKSLRLITGGLDASVVRAIAAAEWPQLEELVLYLGTSRYGANATMNDVRALLAGTFPKLRTLALCNSETYQAQIAAAVVGSKLVAQLQRLDLSKGTMIDADAEPLLVAANRLRHLELDVTENYFSPAVEKALRKLGKHVDASQQRYGEMIEERDRYGSEDWAIKSKATFRYAAVGE